MADGRENDKKTSGKPEKENGQVASGGTDREAVDLETLAGEYVVGVLSAEDRRNFEKLASEVTDVAEARLRWERRFAGLNDSYVPVAVPAGVKMAIDARLFPQSQRVDAQSGGFLQSLGLWRGMTAFASAIAVAVGIWGAGLNTDLEQSRNELTAALQAGQEAETALSAFENEIASRGQQLANAEDQLASMTERYERESEALAQLQEVAGDQQARIAEMQSMITAREAELASARDEVDQAQLQLADAKNALEEALASPQSLLVVSLESPETDYRFLAVHEPGKDEVRMTRVSGEIENNRDYELWLVRPEGSTISLGVIPSGKTAVSLTPEYRDLLENGGLLAVSIEEKGGSPTGVAQGPVVAVGAPNEL